MSFRWQKSQDFSINIWYCKGNNPTKSALCLQRPDHLPICTAILAGSLVYKSVVMHRRALAAMICLCSL
jgi:hypothetical protein